MFPIEAFYEPNKHLLLSLTLSPSILGTRYYSLACDNVDCSLTFCPPCVRSLHPSPGCCAGHGAAASLKSSIEFPDDTLQFIKSHPLMDTAVPSMGDEPWFTKTRVR